MTVAKAHEIGPYSRPHRLRKLDGRSREARYLRRIESELIAHLGGTERVNAAQRILIERLAVDLLRLELLDGKVATGDLTEADGRIAHALRGSVRLALRDIGLEGATAHEATIGELLENGRAA
jgi:hypothetical protein